MSAPIRLRRSVLFLPGANPRALEKARGLPADGLIFDLEDAVAPAGKDTARASVAATLRTGGYAPRELILRVNPLETPWGHADLAAAASLPLDAVLLPKVEHAERVQRQRRACRSTRCCCPRSSMPNGCASRSTCSTPSGRPPISPCGA